MIRCATERGAYSGISRPLRSNTPSRTPTLTCPGFGSMSAYSGFGDHVDDPGSTALEKEGPLPIGTYYIIDRQSGGRSIGRPEPTP